MLYSLSPLHVDTGSRASQLVSQGVTQVFFQLLVRESRSDPPDELILNIHQVLAKLAVKGKPNWTAFPVYCLLR